MAALAGGLPVAAGVFVVSKVFEKQVNRLSSGVYTIGGNWDEPTVTFDRIFDDAARAAAAAGALDPNTPLPDIGLLTEDETASGPEADGVTDSADNPPDKKPEQSTPEPAEAMPAPPGQPPAS